MVTKSFLIALLATSVPVFAETLVTGSVYFDSQKTLEEVVKLSAERDNQSILKLISNGQVSQPSTPSLVATPEHGTLDGLGQ